MKLDLLKKVVPVSVQLKDKDGNLLEKYETRNYYNFFLVIDDRIEIPIKPVFSNTLALLKAFATEKEGGK
jgi:hypothetical protein